jgi:hypothetical protein
VQLVGGDAELLGDLGVGGAAMQAVLQGDVGLLDLAALNRTDRGIQSIARSSSFGGRPTETRPATYLTSGA